MASADHGLLQELRRKNKQLQRFRNSLSVELQSDLDQCDWSIIPQEGHNGLPLITIRLPGRVILSDPFLVDLATQAENCWGPVDFALFSGEADVPLRVLSQTLLDRRWHWHG